MAEWTHNVCERDWFSNPRFSAHESGGFRMPTRIVTPVGPEPDHNDICCVCGVPTVSGIYVRANQNTMTCKGDHEHPDKWSPFLGRPIPAMAVEQWAKEQAIHAALQRDDDYTPEAMDRTER